MGPTGFNLYSAPTLRHSARPRMAYAWTLEGSLRITRNEGPYNRSLLSFHLRLN
jgi:hypothetical protein